eukprot:COSAG02_NODE_370_length_23672_cov_318.104738_18_plen_227_part_00
MLVFNSTTYAYNHASFTTQTMSSPALPNTLYVSGECAQLWLPSKDPKIDTMSMGMTYECDGPTGVNVTVYKDSNCFVTGSVADFYRGGIGTGFKPSDSLIKAGASHTLSAGKPFILGTIDGVTMATKIDEVHGCKSTPPPPRPSPPPPPRPSPPPPPRPSPPPPPRPSPPPQLREGPFVITKELFIIAIVVAAVVGLGVGMLAGAKCLRGERRDESSIQGSLIRSH